MTLLWSDLAPVLTATHHCLWINAPILSVMKSLRYFMNTIIKNWSWMFVHDKTHSRFGNPSQKLSFYFLHWSMFDWQHSVTWPAVHGRTHLHHILNPNQTVKLNTFYKLDSCSMNSISYVERESYDMAHIIWAILHLYYIQRIIVI